MTGEAMTDLMNIEQRLRAQVRGMTVEQLREAASWHAALADHADENFRHAAYHREKLIATICSEELASRS